MVSNNYTKEDCLSALKEAKDILGHAPSQHEYKQLDISPSYQTIATKFDRWNIAKKELGMELSKPSHLKYQDGPPDILSYTEKEWNNLSKTLRFRRRNQAIVAEKKLENGCSECGYNKNPSALDFHHTNTESKERSVSQMIQQGLSTDRILNEIDKCVVLCANCHREEESIDVYDV